MRRLIFLLWGLLAATTAAAAESADATLESALAQARARKAPVLVDFHAPWCYSCYYMAHNVLTGPEWDKLRRQAVVLELDADSPQGDALKTKWQVKAMPSYLVIDAQGKELGRILGEQTREDFYARMHDILGRGATLDALAATVRDGSKAAVAAAREVLKSYHARYDAGGGLAWVAGLPAAAQAGIAGDDEAKLWKRRLEFLQAAQARDGAPCAAIGTDVLAGNLGCDRAYELDRYLRCTDGLPQRKELLSAQRTAADKLVADSLSGKAKCADHRSIVLVDADLHEALGDREASSRTLDRAIADTRKRLGSDVAGDRNLADNLRVFLDHAGRTDELDALMVKLIAAYPDDYVYAYRHGKSLLARGKAAEALPFLDAAAQKAYGVNRLKVAEQRVLALQALKRNDDARKVVAETLKANGPWFADDAAKLKAMVKS